MGMHLTHLLRIFFALGVVSASFAGPISFNGYDISNAVLTGNGNWAHTFDGTITPGVNFTNFTNPGTTATYSGVGSGTLNDGVIGASISNSQLFVTPGAENPPDPTFVPVEPEIILTLSHPYTINTIEIFGGDIPNNAIPGAITGVTIGLIAFDFSFHQETFLTEGFGTVLSSVGVQVNDRVTLTGSTLEGIPAVAVSLFAFQGNVSNWISITEITLDGDRFVPSNPIPEPTTGLLAAFALAALVWRGSQR